MSEERPYNPLDKENLGKSVQEALLEKPVVALPPERFTGAGVYVLYYTGAFKLYRPVAERKRKGRWAEPIYVGKAVPPGARKGGYGLDADPGEVLWRRLAEHAESIQQAKNLVLSDFSCRYLVADDIWIPLGESLLIESFNPLWNKCLDGFGNHDPGSGRYNQQRSAWDVLHPGRTWAARLQPNARGRDGIEKLVLEFLRNRPVP